MKRHGSASVVRTGKRDEGGVARRVAAQTPTAFKRSRAKPASRDRSLALTSVRSWTHTLTLTGELNHRSAHALEAEIERLCEQGVTAITLDLRELTYIDSIGVAVIAFRCDLCKKRGYDFALIAGSRLIHRAFEQAAVSELLPFHENDIPTTRPPTLVLE